MLMRSYGQVRAGRWKSTEREREREREKGRGKERKIGVMVVSGVGKRFRKDMH